MSHRDRADLGTHLSRGENRGSYVDEADLHLSLRSFRDDNDQITLSPRRWIVNGFEKHSSRGLLVVGEVDRRIEVAAAPQVG